MWAIIILSILIFILAISISWTRSRGAPWFPTPMRFVHEMLRMAEVGPENLVYDLGCGDGRIIVAAARQYGARAVGIELDPLRYLWCQVLITVLGLRQRVQIIYGDFFQQDLSAADVITCYLLTDTNKKLESKFKRELRPGTRVVSHYFSFPGLQFASENAENKLYLYTVPG